MLDPLYSFSLQVIVCKMFYFLSLRDNSDHVTVITLAVLISLSYYIARAGAITESCLTFDSKISLSFIVYFVV